MIRGNIKNNLQKRLKKVIGQVVILSMFVVSINAVPANASEMNQNEYELGEVVNAGKDTGFSKEKEISKKDPHFSWELGSFSLTGFTRVIANDEKTVFLKTSGDKIILNFKLEQDINALNNDQTLSIADDKKAYDSMLYRDETEFGRGALIIRKTDAYQNKKGRAQLYTNYLEGVKKGADTQIEVCEEGDYEVALDYSIRDKKMTLPVIDKTIRSTYNDYRIYFTFSVRNGNCMVFPFDVTTGAELTNKAITENGFYLDLAKSKYLDINIKKEVLQEGATGLTEDIRYNKAAREGEQYTEEGIYTITVSNQYTGEETVKKIYVGNDNVLKAYMVTGYSIDDIQNLLKEGAQIHDNGEISIPTDVDKPEVVESVSDSAIVLKEARDGSQGENENMKTNGEGITKLSAQTMVLICVGVILVVIIVLICWLVKRKNRNS